MWLFLHIITVTFAGDGVKRLAPCGRTTRRTYYKRHEQQGYHAVCGCGEAVAVLAIYRGEHKTLDRRQATNDEEHQTLCAGTELCGEELGAPEGIENLY